MLTVLLACPGLDHAHRGFETFARECFEALRGRPDLRIELVKGTGRRTGAERVVPTLTRDTRAARALARGAAVEPFVVEHVAFALALVPLVERHRPDVVYFSEWHVGRVLAAWRRVSSRRFALVLSNGSLAPGPYAHLDRVQQLAPGAMDYTVLRGEAAQRQEHLPLGVAMDDEPLLLDDQARAKLRARLGLPADRTVVLSAGALNRQKRLDYLIEEVASLPAPRPYLVLAGQEERETAALRRLARRRLGDDGHDLRTVPPDGMADLYRASDAFVLASLWESFGRVLVEALSHGVPCLAHDDAVMRWVLGDAGETADLTRQGSVARWLNALSTEQLSDAARRRRHRCAHERFSWATLADRYVEMLSRAADDRR